MVNAGAYVPTQYGGPCTKGISTCRSDMANAFASACTNYKTGYTLGVFGDYHLSYYDPTYGDIATIIAGWINKDINGECFRL
jgi:hypothetical protein